MRFILLAHIFLLPIQLFSRSSENTGIFFSGEITDYRNNLPIDSVKIEITDIRYSQTEFRFTDKNGKWDSIFLAYGKNYLLIFHHGKYYKKKIQVILADISRPEANKFIKTDEKLIPNENNQCYKTALENSIATTLMLNTKEGKPEWEKSYFYSNWVSHWETCSEYKKELVKIRMKNSNSIFITGKISDRISGIKILCSEVKLFKNDSLIKLIYADEAKFKVTQLDTGNIYRVEYSHPNYYSRYLIIDLRKIPGSDFYFNEIPTDMTLVDRFSTHVCDTSFLKLPSGILRYSKNIEDLEWDLKSVDRYRKGIEKFLNCIEANRKYIEKN